MNEPTDRDRRPMSDRSEVGEGQAGPSAEMLAKAAELLGESVHPWGCPPICRQLRVALALEEADEDAVNLAAENARLLVERAEALRASESEVESLRKERDAEKAVSEVSFIALEDIGRMVGADWNGDMACHSDVPGAVRRTLEAAHAEATKAEADRDLWRKTHDRHCGLEYCPGHHHEDLAAIRAPRPSEHEHRFITDEDGAIHGCRCGAPYVPSSPPPPEPHVHTYDCSGNLGGFDCPSTTTPPSASTWHWSTDPDGPPPSEEPR